MSNQEPEIIDDVAEAACEEIEAIITFKTDVAAKIAAAVKTLEDAKVAREKCRLVVANTLNLLRYKKLMFKELQSSAEDMIALVSADDELGHSILTKWFGEEKLKDYMAKGNFFADAFIDRVGFQSDLFETEPTEAKKLQEIEGLAIVIVAYGVTTVFSADELLGLEKVYYPAEWALWGIWEELKKRNPRKKRAFLENLYGNIITGRAQMSRDALWILKSVYMRHGFISHAVYLDMLYDQYDKVYGN